MNIKGIGTDIVNRERFINASEELINKFLTKEERELYDSLAADDRLDFLSGRWAAKEAIVKASNKELIYSNLSILKSESGMPTVFHYGKLKEEIKISISHEKEYTIAFCVIEKV